MISNTLRAAALIAICWIAFAESTPETSQPAVDPELVEKGRAVYAAFCLACHGAEDVAIESPSNLFDREWHYGNEPEQIERSIRKGILEKGMPAWDQMITDEDIDSLVAYLLSFQTTTDDTDE